MPPGLDMALDVGAHRGRGGHLHAHILGHDVETRTGIPRIRDAGGTPVGDGDPTLHCRFSGKRPVRRLLAIATVLAALAAPPAALAIGDCAPGSDWPAASGSDAAQVISLVNTHRADLGLGPLSTLGPLGAAAAWKARHMAMYTYMAHEDPAPPVDRSVGERLAACGYTGGAWGENIAYGYPSAEAVVAAWLASPGHRANIENPRYTAIGVGAAASAGGAVYWAQEFGVSSTPAPPSLPPPDPEPETQPPIPQPQPGPGPEPAPAEGSEAEPPAPSPSPEPDPTSAPTAMRVHAGRITDGTLESLASDDGRLLALRSRARSTSWSANVVSPIEEPGALRVVYRGSSSARCNQTVALWNFERRAWDALDTRRVGGRELTVEPEVEADGHLRGGQARVRVTCARAARGPFTTRADLLEIVWS